MQSVFANATITSSPNQVVETNTYRFECPADWVVANKSSVTAVATLTDDEGGISVISVNIYSSDGLSLEEFIEASITDMKKTSPKSKIIINERLKNSRGEDYQHWMISTIENNATVFLESYFFVKEGVASMIMFACEQSAFPRKQKIGKLILDSFITKGRPTGEFALYENDNCLFEYPIDWSLTESAPNIQVKPNDETKISITVSIEKIPEGMNLQSYSKIVMKNLSKSFKNFKIRGRKKTETSNGECVQFGFTYFMLIDLKANAHIWLKDGIAYCFLYISTKDFFAEGEQIVNPILNSFKIK